MNAMIHNATSAGTVAEKKSWARRGLDWCKQKLHSAVEVAEEVAQHGKEIATAAIATVATFIGMDSAMAADPVVLPTMPVDFAGYATAALSVAGTVFAAVAGIIVVYALIKLGFNKLSGALKGRAG